MSTLRDAETLEDRYGGLAELRHPSRFFKEDADIQFMWLIHAPDGRLVTVVLRVSASCDEQSLRLALREDPAPGTPDLAEVSFELEVACESNVRVPS